MSEKPCMSEKPRQSHAAGAAMGRRGFLGILGAGTLAATVPLVTDATADTESPDEKRKARYRESDEVKTFYRVNRYPA